MANLRSSLTTLAAPFIDEVLAAIRTACLDKLMVDVGQPCQPSSMPRSNGTAPRRTSTTMLVALLARRALALADVHDLLRRNSRGPRSDVREAVKLEKPTIPRLIDFGLGARTMRSKHLKLSTTYHAA